MGYRVINPEEDIMTLDELFASAEEMARKRLAEDEAFDRTPEGQRLIAERASEREAERQMRVRLGWETEDGDAIPDQGEGEDEEEEGGGID